MIRIHRRLLVLPWLGLLLALAVIAGCDSDTNEPWNPPDPDRAALYEPDLLTERAPDNYSVRLLTSEGFILINVTRSWSPNGADRFYNLVKHGFYDDVRFFRVLENFMAQCGIHGDPLIQARWREATIPDDAPTGADRQSNQRGFISFAKTGMPHSRSTQIFINFKDNSMLDPQGFTPFGQVTVGMNVVDKLYRGYGEGAPRGSGPDQGRIQIEGNSYLAAFPELDYIITARLRP